MLLVDVPPVPEAGRSDALAIAAVAEPSIRGRIERGAFVVAHKRDGVSLDAGAPALRPTPARDRAVREHRCRLVHGTKQQDLRY